MAVIQYGSIDDQFGLRAAGSALAQVLMQNSLLERKNQFEIDKEMRELKLRKQFGPLLSKALSAAYDPNATPQMKSQALSSYLSAGGSISDVASAYKQVAQENQTAALLRQFGINPPQSNFTAPSDADQNQNNIASPEAISQNQQSQMQAGQQLTPQASNLFEQIPEDVALALAASPNQSVSNTGKVALEAKKMQQSRFEADRKYETQFALPFMNKIGDQRAAVENKSRALEQLQQAIAQGDSGMFSINNLARIFNRPELINATGAQLLSAVKELLVSNIGRVGSRPNQWIEQQISLALPDLGKSPIANAILAEGVKGEVELSKRRIELADKFAAEDRAKYGYIRGDIESRVDRAIKPFADQIDMKAGYRMRELFEQEKGGNYLRKNLMNKVPNGTPLTKNMYLLFKENYGGNAAQAIENARKLGYTILNSNGGQ